MKCFKFYFPYYFCLGWISVASHGLSPVVASGGYSSFSVWGGCPSFLLIDASVYSKCSL